jgi:hypothetical protein
LPVFCAYFNLRNSFPPLPNCFCNQSVLIKFSDKGEFLLACPNYNVDGARPKCNWELDANQVPFKRPEGCTHPLPNRGSNKLLQSYNSGSRVRIVNHDHDNDREVIFYGDHKRSNKNHNHRGTRKSYHNKDQQPIRSNGRSSGVTSYLQDRWDNQTRNDDRNQNKPTSRVQ